MIIYICIYIYTNLHKCVDLFALKRSVYSEMELSIESTHSFSLTLYYTRAVTSAIKRCSNCARVLSLFLSLSLFIWCNICDPSHKTIVELVACTHSLSLFLFLPFFLPPHLSFPLSLALYIYIYMMQEL